MRLGELVVHRTPGAIAPGNAVGIKNVAVQIALGILQQRRVLRPQIPAIVGKESLYILVQDRSGEGLAEPAKIPAGACFARFLLRLLCGKRNQLTNDYEARDGDKQGP